MKKQTEKYGRPPGSLIFVGTQKVVEPRVEVYEYNKETVSQARCQGLEELLAIKVSEMNSWINVTGIHDIELIRQVGEAFDMHALQKEAVLNTDQRPRYEFDNNAIFIIVKMIQLDKAGKEIETEQVSILVGERYIISFQEAEHDVFGPVRERLLNPESNMRNRGTDYMAFALMDSIVDNYILILEEFGEEIEDMEDILLKSPSKAHLELLSDFKRDLSFFNKNVRPMREVINRFLKTESPLLVRSTIPYLKDLEDHVAHAIDSIDTYRDMLNDHLNIYNSGMNNRLNDVIRVLTIFSVVFIPLTFVAGVYGTNFQNFPELGWKWAYPTFWVVEILIAIGMLWYFKRKQWL